MPKTTENQKIIKITDHFKTEYTPWIQSGIDALRSMDLDQQNGITELILNYVFMEVKVGLGLIDPINGDEPDLRIFRRISDIYEEAAGDCYFCSGTVDPNDDPFKPGETPICPMCSLKLMNFAQSLGLQANNIFRPRKQNH